MRATCTFLGFALAVISALPGCGEAHDATTRELSALTAEISRLRAEQTSIAERLFALERGRPAPAPGATAGDSKPAAPAPAAAGQALDADRPALDVVRLGPTSDDGADGDGDVDADGPRTVLRSGASGIIVEEAGAGTPPRAISSDPPKKTPPKKTDKAKKTAALPTP